MDTILYKAFSLVLVIIIGQAIKKIGWVSSADFPKFSRIVLRLTIPCAVITGFNGVSITYKLLLLTVIGIGVNLIAQVTGYLLNRHKSGKEKAFGINNIGSYNIAALSNTAIPSVSPRILRSGKRHSQPSPATVSRRVKHLLKAAT